MYCTCVRWGILYVETVLQLSFWHPTMRNCCVNDPDCRSNWCPFDNLHATWYFTLLILLWIHLQWSYIQCIIITSKSAPHKVYPSVHMYNTLFQCTQWYGVRILGKLQGSCLSYVMSKHRPYKISVRTWCLISAGLFEFIFYYMVWKVNMIKNMK